MSDGFLKEVAMPPKAAKQHAERAVPVGTNFLLGRAKSCQWQVFVRRRPPKQGELRTDVSKATMFQGDGAAKDLIGFVRSCRLSGLIRGL